MLERPTFPNQVEALLVVTLPLNIALPVQDANGDTSELFGTLMTTLYYMIEMTSA
jgi:hypothetical protein